MGSGGVGVAEAKELKKSNEMKAFPLRYKFIFYFFAGLPKSPNPWVFSIYFKIKARSKAEARMPGLQHHMGLGARNLKEQ